VDAERLRKIRRIQRVQEDLHRLAEWRLSVLAREERVLAERQEALIASLNEDDVLHGLFVEAMARRLKTLAGEAERLRAAQEVQTERVLDEARRLKRAERMGDRAAADHRRGSEKRDLAALIEALAARPEPGRP